MKKIIVLLMPIIVMFNSCGDTGVEPEPQTGRRDYVWTVDTFQLGGFYPTFWRIWGSSPEDVYVIGEGNPPQNNIWHYDGKIWKPVSDGSYFNLSALYGFSKNDIWLSSVDNGEVWHYDGSMWKLITILQVDGYKKVYIQNFYGTKPNNVYACGQAFRNSDDEAEGMLFHYDGSSWKRFPASGYEGMIFSDVRMINDSTPIIRATGFHNDLEKILIWNGKNYHEILSTFEGTSLINIGEGVYYSNGKKIYRYGKENFTLLHDFTGTDFKVLLGGRDEKDIFAITKSGIGHYNGTDLQLVYKVVFCCGSISIFEKDIFIIPLYEENKLDLIIHGVLKE